MKVVVAASLVAVSLGCATVVPMQTASVVEEGAWRFGGQASAAAFCNLEDVTKCHDYPDGIQTPELRADVRRGVAPRQDVGASLQLQPVLFSPERPLQIGLSLDGKWEWSRIEKNGYAYIISTGLLLGGAVSGRLGLRPWYQLDYALPVFYGVQTGSWELVFGLSLANRVVFPAGRTPTDHEFRLGASAGFFRRVPEHWAAQVTYLTDVRYPESGALVLQFGLFWDAPARESN